MKFTFSKNWPRICISLKVALEEPGEKPQVKSDFKILQDFGSSQNIWVKSFLKACKQIALEFSVEVSKYFLDLELPQCCYKMLGVSESETIVLKRLMHIWLLLRFGNVWKMSWNVLECLEKNTDRCTIPNTIRLVVSTWCLRSYTEMIQLGLATPGLAMTKLPWRTAKND